MVFEDTDIGWTVGRGDSPLVATAIHAGHGLRAAPGLLEELARA